MQVSLTNDVRLPNPLSLRCPCITLVSFFPLAAPSPLLPLSHLSPLSVLTLASSLVASIVNYPLSHLICPPAHPRPLLPDSLFIPLLPLLPPHPASARRILLPPSRCRSSTLTTRARSLSSSHPVTNLRNQAQVQRPQRKRTKCDKSKKRWRMPKLENARRQKRG